LQAPTIQTGQTRENNITVKKMWQKKSLAKLQSDTLRRQELQKSQSMQSTIDSRADLRDMASKPKATINQETEIRQRPAQYHLKTTRAVAKIFSQNTENYLFYGYIYWRKKHIKQFSSPHECQISERLNFKINSYFD
jgi:hypothetical protein